MCVFIKVKDLEIFGLPFHLVHRIRQQKPVAKVCSASARSQTLQTDVKNLFAQWGLCSLVEWRSRLE